MAYPVIVFLVSGSFMLAVARQFAAKRRPYQLAWSLSLFCAMAGSLAYVVFLADGKSELAFRLYYIFGALLTAPMLGLGSLLLVARSDLARACANIVVAVVALAAAAGALLLLTNPVNTGILRALDGGPGSHPDVYRSGPWEPLLVVLNIFGAACVVGVAVYSGWLLYRRHGSRRLVIANVLIALGTYVISQAGAQARTGFGAGAFWLTMALGWIVLFAGFLTTFNLQRDAPVTTGPLTQSMAAP